MYVCAGGGGSGWCRWLWGPCRREVWLTGSHPGHGETRLPLSPRCSSQAPSPQASVIQALGPGDFLKSTEAGRCGPLASCRSPSPRHDSVVDGRQVEGTEVGQAAQL